MIGFSDRPWTSAAVPHPLTGSIELEKLGAEDLDAPGDILMNLLNVGEEGYTKGLDEKTELDLTPNDSTDQNSKWADELFIHELTHIWQSQHGENGIEYMINSMLSQALRPDMSGCAYIFTPGNDFKDYGAEQIATIVEYYYIMVRDSITLDIDTTGDGNMDTSINLNDLQPIIDIIQNALPNEPVPENIESLSTPKQGCVPLIQLPF